MLGKLCQYCLRTGAQKVGHHIGRSVLAFLPLSPHHPQQSDRPQLPLRLVQLFQAPLASVGGQTRAAGVQGRQSLQAAKIQDLAALKLARK
jgi:hypothetical protein